MERELGVKDGIKQGLPLAMGYIPVAIAFALLGKSYGIPDLVIILMSSVIYAGSSQFIGVKLMSLGLGTPEIVLTTFIVNFRNFLMSSAVAQRIDDDIPALKRAAIAYTVTDETFAVATTSVSGNIPTSYLVGLQGLLFFAYNLATIAGVLFIQDMSPRITQSLGITIYAMFLSILVPSVRKSSRLLRIAIFSAALSSLLTYQPIVKLSMGWIIIIATVVTAGGYAYLSTKEESRE